MSFSEGFRMTGKRTSLITMLSDDFIAKTIKLSNECYLAHVVTLNFAIHHRAFASFCMGVIGAYTISAR